MVRRNEKNISEDLGKVETKLQEEAAARNDLQKKVEGQLEQQEMQMQALNGYISNINTGSIAQDMVRQLDAYAQKLGPRMDVATTRLDAADRQFKVLRAEMEAWAPQQQQQQQQQQQAGKRPASPQTYFNDMSKKRRLEPTTGDTSRTASARSGSGAYR
jgi:hypothetical protein